MTTGVDYYNILQYIKTNKNKEEQIIEDKSLAETNDDMGLPDASGLAPEVLSRPVGSPGVLGEVLDALPEEIPILNEDMIERAPLQFFDNGPDSKQRYKFKVRLNLHNDKECPEFIAGLTRDMRIFKKHIPEEGGLEILDLARDIRSVIKEKFGEYPLLGKFHLNNGRTNGIHKIQNEPYTFVAVWFNQYSQGWEGCLQLYSWEHKFDLFDTNITPKQKTAGIVGSSLFINPKYVTNDRPKTWAERRALRSSDV